MAIRNPVAAKRYAEALFQVGESADVRNQTLLELKAFQNILQSSKEVGSFFVNPTIPEAEKNSAIDAVKEKLPLTARFLTALVEANRMENFSEIVSTFERMKEDESGELSVEVTSAHPIDGLMLDEIQQTLSSKWKRKLKISTAIDPQLIGGFIAKAPGKVFDASVANQLATLEQQMLA